MPRFDGTGPRGTGSKTGRGLGTCKSRNTQNTTQFNNTEEFFFRAFGRCGKRQRKPGNNAFGYK